MKDLKYTPGEWLLHWINSDNVEVKCGSKLIADLQTYSFYSKSGLLFEELEANAKLIAAAPDLLKACISISESGRISLQQESMLKDVIKKASK